MAVREQFSSRAGFVMAAAGSAVGLGNIWGFPTQAAGNGGAAFVLMYVALAFLLAYPVLMTELLLGRYARANAATALEKVSHDTPWQGLGRFTGYYGMVVASLILSFYAIIAGWMLAYLVEAFVSLFGLSAAESWLTSSSFARDFLFCGIFMLLTMGVIVGGVKKGIEKWSSLMMPSLLFLLLCLIVYVLLQPGALEGLKVYLIPDFSQLADPGLLISALGQAFFSLSLGVGTMLVYGSYLSKEDSLPKLGFLVTLVDMGVAFAAGLLILPAIFVAQNYGAEIYTDGALVAGPDLIFRILPHLFDSMGSVGPWVAVAFFLLMSLAALTSSISMLEVPVALVVERRQVSRPRAALLIGTIIFGVSAGIMLNFDSWFGWVVDFTTKYSQPLLGLLMCVIAGWVWRRSELLIEIQKGHPEIEDTLFWKIWPRYMKYICPVLILITFIHSVYPIV